MTRGKDGKQAGSNQEVVGIYGQGAYSANRLELDSARAGVDVVNRAN